MYLPSNYKTDSVSFDVIFTVVTLGYLNGQGKMQF